MLRDTNLFTACCIEFLGVPGSSLSEVVLENSHGREKKPRGNPFATTECVGNPPADLLLALFFKSVFLDLTLSSYFLSLSPLLLLSLGFGSVVVIKDIAGLDLLFVVTSLIVLSAGVPVSTTITATTLKYCCGSHKLRQFYREEGRLCHRFLPSIVKDSFEFRTTCRS